MELSMEQLEMLIQLAANTGAQAACSFLAGDQGAIVRDAARKGADALKREQTAIRKRERSEHIDKRLHNTRLLLKNYRMLKEHFQNAIYTFDEEMAAIEDEPGYLFKLLNNGTASDEVYIESIRKSATRTMITLQHLDRMLEIYAALCDTSPMESMKRQYRVMKARYLDEPQVSMLDIADREHIHKRTAEKDLDAAIESITALIFGIDAIKDLTGGY